MTLSLSAQKTDLAGSSASVLALPLESGATLTPALTSLDTTLGGALSRTLSRKDFRGTKDEVLHLAGGTTGPQRVLLIGIGTTKNRGEALQRAAAIASRRAHALGAPSMAWYAGAVTSNELERIAVGLHHGVWEYNELKAEPPADEQKPELTSATIYLDDLTGGEEAIRVGNAIGTGYALARKLAMMPGNLCTPAYFEETARDLAHRHNLEAAVLGRHEMAELNMGAFLGVAQGTPQEPKLVVLQYRGGAPSEQPIAFVGKGLCFDSGGISIKPAQGMEFMKFDMCGAAGVLGAIETIALLRLPINVVGIIGATTNMPSGTAINPGDVVHASSGTTIEVINTDAEGRLVLADLLTYVKRYDPSVVIDAATLTGAVVIALGHIATGAFGSHTALVHEVIAAGERLGERAWHLPLWDEYKEQIKSDVADLKNTGGRPAGSITAAKFLEAFAVGYQWVHLDIAGTAYSENDLVTIPKGPTGVPVGMFVEFARGRAPRGVAR